MNSQPQQTETERLGYSGATEPGLTPNGSYDRMIWNGENDAHTSMEEVTDLAAERIDEFNQSGKTRLMIRTQLHSGPEHDTDALRNQLQLQLHKQLKKVGIQESASYFDPHKNSHSIFAAVNKEERSVSGRAIRRIQNRVIKTVHRHADCVSSPENFNDHALEQKRIVDNAGLQFCDSATAEEMFALWGDPFGWSKEQCEQQERCLSEDERVFALKDRDGQVVSGIYVADGETTEWATLPEHQGKGLIVPLLIYSHCSLINEDIRSVFAEARWNRSVSASIQSGLRVPTWNRRPWTLTNHVSIGDDPAKDPEDSWNKGRAPLQDETNGAMLRSFAIAHLDTDLFTDDLIHSYLNQS
jgi:hypothetical protein